MILLRAIHFKDSYLENEAIYIPICKRMMIIWVLRSRWVFSSLSPLFIYLFIYLFCDITETSMKRYLESFAPFFK